jgi:hypothetical protein
MGFIGLLGATKWHISLTSWCYGGWEQ